MRLASGSATVNDVKFMLAAGLKKNIGRHAEPVDRCENFKGSDLMHSIETVSNRRSNASTGAGTEAYRPDYCKVCMFKFMSFLSKSNWNI